MDVGRHEGAGSAADVHQRVVDGVAHGAHVFLATRAPWCPQPSASPEPRQKPAGPERMPPVPPAALRFAPAAARLPQRAQQEIGAARIKYASASARGIPCCRPRAPPNTGRNQTSPPKKPVRRAGLLRRETQGFVQIARQRRERRVVGKPLEQLADVGDPERTLEAGANVVPTLGKAQMVLLRTQLKRNFHHRRHGGHGGNPNRKLLRVLRASVVNPFLPSAEEHAQFFFHLRGLHARNANQFLAAGFSGGYRN